MRTSQLLIPTLKETPADAELISHQLMLRAGLIRKLASGLYTWMPLGLRILKKVENIIRQQMNNAGCQEVLMPMVQPGELWQETGRWEKYGAELLRLEDRHQRKFCLGPTHEEVITDLVRNNLASYKQLPICLYQIQTKFRDEIRPRFGIMRAREFLMKDAYSFHLSSDCLQKTYQQMYDAYSNIFTEIGLKFRAVEADSGSIGGNYSHEFHVLAQSGEDTIAYSTESNYAANVELAPSPKPPEKPVPTHNQHEVIDTPKQQTIEQVCSFLKTNADKTIKTLIVKSTEGSLIALILRGDHELNATKAEKLDEIQSPLTFASEEEIIKTIGCKPGFLGPVNLNIPMIVDPFAYHTSDFICGANQPDKHIKNANWETDTAKPTRIADVRNVVEGDTSPDNKGTLKLARGIEVGHVFQLGQQYSAAMKATTLNEQGNQTILTMGCYGIGVSRIIAAAIEQNYDDNGIIWPQSIAPFQVALTPIHAHKSEAVQKACTELYQQLQQANIEVLWDDRNERPGVMFSNMDLIGIPHRLVISDKGLANNTIEHKARNSDKIKHIPLTEAISFITQELAK